MSYDDVPSPYDLTNQILGGARRMIAYGLDRRVGEDLLAALPEDADVNMLAKSFIAEAERWEERAEEKVAAGALVTARAWYRQAFYLYRVADFAYTEKVETKAHAYDGVLRTFAAATSGTEDAPESVAIRCDGLDFDALLVLPRGTDAAPACLFIYGSDGIKEEHYWASALPLLARGIGVLIPDGPGQGTALRKHGIPARPDSEVFAAACVDLLEKDPRVLSGAVGIMGSSAGGYLAPRAFAHEPRLKVCQVNSALHTVLEGSWVNYRAALPQLRYNVQADTYEEAFEMYQAFTLSGVTNIDSSRPARIWHGSEDERIPATQAAKLEDFLGDNTETTVWVGADHNLVSIASRSFPEMWDWMAGQLKAISVNH